MGVGIYIATHSDLQPFERDKTELSSGSFSVASLLPHISKTFLDADILIVFLTPVLVEEPTITQSSLFSGYNIVVWFRQWCVLLINLRRLLIQKHQLALVPSPIKRPLIPVWLTGSSRNQQRKAREENK